MEKQYSTLVAVYNNLSAKKYLIKKEDVKEQIEYDAKARPGRALFIDGKVIQTGYLDDDTIEKLKPIINKITAKSSDYVEEFDIKI